MFLKNKCVNVQQQWHYVFREGRDPIKERNKQKREAMRNLYYLKDIALDTFESRKTELKNDDKNGHWFLPLTSKPSYISVSKITKTDIRDTLPCI